MKLLLFDIDGTLLRTRDVGRQAVERVLSDVCGRPVTTDGVTFSGKTDPQILRDVLRVNGFDAHEADRLLPAALEAYVDVARPLLRPEHVDVLHGVVELLTHLATRNDVQLGLLTGNVEPTAYAKLAAAQLDHHFKFGAFGSDHEDRYQLPPVALDRAHQHTGRRFAGADVVIIGDTEHDIGCGRGIGARSVAVCTGRYSRAELEAHRPHVLLDDLGDADLFCRHVLAA